MKRFQHCRHVLIVLIAAGFLSLSLNILTACISPLAQTINDHRTIDYFCKIAVETEFSFEREVHKWADDIQIYKAGKWPQYMSDELNRIIKEINSLMVRPKLSLTESGKDANFIIFLGRADQYLYIEPLARRTEDNWGLFCIHWNHKKEIFRGSMYVDMHRTRHNKLQMHLLREELTQSLGLMNDSGQYRDSMFYQYFSETTSYSELDKLMIKLLYQPEIKAGMNKAAAKEVIKENSLLSRLQ